MTITEIAVELARCLESLRREGSEEWWELERWRFSSDTVSFHFKVMDGLSDRMWTVARSLKPTTVNTADHVRQEVEVAYRMLRARSTVPV